MSHSKFDRLAELEALRAGFEPSGVRFTNDLPRLIPLGKATAPAPSRIDVAERDVRVEMERRLAAHLSRRRDAA